MKTNKILPTNFRYAVNNCQKKVDIHRTKHFFSETKMELTNKTYVILSIFSFLPKLFKTTKKLPKTNNDLLHEIDILTKNVGANPYWTTSQLVGKLENPKNWPLVKPRLLKLSEKYPAQVIQPLVKTLSNPVFQHISENILLEIADNNAYKVGAQLTGKLNNPDICPKAEHILLIIGNKHPAEIMRPLFKVLINPKYAAIAERLLLKIGKNNPYEASQKFMSVLIKPKFQNISELAEKVKELIKIIAQKDISKTLKPIIKHLDFAEGKNIAKELLCEIGSEQPYKTIKRFIRSISNQNYSQSTAKELGGIISTICNKYPAKSMAGLIDLLAYQKSRTTAKKFFYPIAFKYPCEATTLLLSKFGDPLYHPAVEEMLTEVARKTPRITKHLLEKELKELLEAHNIPFLIERIKKAIEFYMGLPGL